MHEIPLAQKLRVGMIGLGGIATRSHLPALVVLPDVAIQAGAEIDTYQANRTQQRFGIPKIYTSYLDMLEQEQLDAVYICLPNALHYQAASAALKRGRHVYCEKPVGLSAHEAGDLDVQAKGAGLVLMPGYHLRFHEHFLRARELLEKRRLGKILQVQASAVYSGPYRGWDPKSDWYLDPRSGGPLYDWGSHLIDLIVYITKLEIETVSALARKSLPGIAVMDNIAAAFQANGNVVGTVNLAWGTRGNLLMLQIHGSAGSLLVSDDYYEHRTPTGGGLNKLGTLLGNANEILTQKAGAIIRRKSNVEIYQKAAQCFIDAIRGKVQMQAATRDAVHVHNVLAAIAKSIEQGGPVDCDRQPDRPKKGTA
jgi:UDP-N-acetylglucosamine 3-dehydrogenase